MYNASDRSSDFIESERLIRERRNTAPHKTILIKKYAYSKPVKVEEIKIDFAEKLAGNGMEQVGLDTLLRPRYSDNYRAPVLIDWF